MITKKTKITSLIQLQIIVLNFRVQAYTEKKLQA